MRCLFLTATALLLLSQSAFAEQNASPKKDFDVVTTLENEGKIRAEVNSLSKEGATILAMREEILAEIHRIKIRAAQIKDILDNLDCYAAKKATSDIDAEINLAEKRRDKLLNDPLCTGDMGEGQKNECRKIGEDYMRELSNLEAMKRKIASICVAK